MIFATRGLAPESKNGASQSLRAPFTFITNNDQTYAKRTLCLVSYEKIGDFLWWLRKKSYLCNQNEETETYIHPHCIYTFDAFDNCCATVGLW